MTRKEFEKLVGEIGYLSVPKSFRPRIKNTVLIVEDEPSEELRAELGLHDSETLLGFYRGIPQTERGEYYGIGMTLPDAIYIFRLPILDEAESSGKAVGDVVRETIWHEVGHHFGLDEREVLRREEEMGWHDSGRGSSG